MLHTKNNIIFDIQRKWSRKWLKTEVWRCDKIRLHLISLSPPTPVEDVRFLLASQDLIKLHSALKTSLKYESTLWRIWVYPWGISWELKIHPQRIPYFFYFTPKEILIFYNLHLKNSIGPQPGDTDINAIAILFLQAACYFFNLLSPKSDQHQISSCNSNALKNRVVMRITDMITQDQFTWYFINLSSLLL